MSETNVDFVLETIGVGRTQVGMIITCGIICFYIANETIGLGLISVSIACDFKISNIQLSLLSSGAFTGLMLSSHFWGFQTDRYGRRKMMLYSLGLSLITSIISILMPEFYSFLVLRILLGLLMSGAVVNTITYLTEYSTIAMRPLVVNFMSYAFPIGIIYVSGMAQLLEPLDRLLFSAGTFDFCEWRLNLILHVSPGIVAFIALWKLPESAKFMLSVGQTDRAYKTLNRLCIKNRKQDLKSLGITSVTQARLRSDIKEHGNCFQRVWHDTVPLFKPPYVLKYVLCTLCTCAYFFVGNGLTLWFIKLIQNLPDSQAILCDVIEMKSPNSARSFECATDKLPISFIDGIYLGCTFLVCCIGITILLMFMGRAHVQFLYAALCTMSGFSINFLKVRALILTGMLLFLSLSAASMPLAATVITDVVPTHLRGKAISLSFMFARLSVVLANILIGTCMTSYCLITFNIFVLIMLMTCILICFLPK